MDAPTLPNERYNIIMPTDVCVCGCGCGMCTHKILLGRVYLCLEKLARRFDLSVSVWLNDDAERISTYAISLLLLLRCLRCDKCV